MDTKFLEEFMKKAEALGFSPDQAISFIKAAADELSNEKHNPTKAEDKKALVAAKSIVDHEKSEIKAASYVEGFVKRATEANLSPEEGIRLLKSALDGADEGMLPHLLAQIQTHPELANALGMGAAGAGVGALGGAALGDDKNKGRNAGIGALAGGLAGAGAGYGIGHMEGDTNLRNMLMKNLQENNAAVQQSQSAGDESIFKQMLRGAGPR